MIADSLYHRRDWIALAPAVLVLATLGTVTLRQVVAQRPFADAMAVVLEELPPVEAPPPETPPPPPEARREPPRPSPVPAPAPRPEPADTRPAEATVPRETPPPPRAPDRPATAAPEATPAPAPAPVAAAPSLENGYVARLRAYLESVRRYPTSREARLQRPQGKVRLWLEIGRDGELRDAGVEQGSGSMILDGAALSTARQGRYPPFPAEAWAGRPAHRFTVTLDYQLEGG